MPLRDEKYLRFTTTRRDGTEVSTPVWLADLGDGRIGFYTSSTSGKAKRLRHTPRAVVQACDMRGNPKPDSRPAEVDVVLADAAELARIHDLIRSKYGGFQVVASRIGGVVGGWIKRRSQPYGDVGVTFRVPQGH
ncbi:MAG: pyridoxamine 5'-phosphate oxidase family protein [Kineosporiaceae bacterium]|nr:pyridoxamine 5'-phosphate oxidase family protein [Kineosporiaceae bacterium]